MGEQVKQVWRYMPGCTIDSLQSREVLKNVQSCDQELQEIFNDENYNLTFILENFVTSTAIAPDRQTVKVCFKSKKND